MLDRQAKLQQLRAELRRDLAPKAREELFSEFREAQQETVRDELKRELGQLTVIADELDAVSTDQSAPLMKDKLDSTLETYATYEYTYTYQLSKHFPGLRSIPFTYTYKMPGELQDLIRSGSTAVDLLSEHQSVVLRSSDLKAIANKKKEMLDGIARGVDSSRAGECL